MINEREIILSILMEMDSGRTYRHSLVRDVLNQYDYLNVQQKGMIKRIVDGVTERRITLDYVLNSFSNTPVHKMKPLIRSLLRMSTYQILYMNGIPDSAAINEAVKLADKRKFQALKGFVNGVLRNISRNKEKIVYPEKSETDQGVQYLSVRYSMPEMFCRMWMKTYGFDQTEKILKAFLEIRPVIIRMDERFTEEEITSLVVRMQEEGGENFEIGKSSLLSYAYELAHTDNIQYLAGYDEGMWMVQDLSSMLVTQAAGIQKGNRVIDVCSAPGGKALHVAAKLSGTGSVIARDVSEAKCSLIHENAARMHMDNIVVQVHDATIPDPSLENTADVLYCDLPCSGLGIIGRKSDIKYGITSETLNSITDLQKKIMQAVWNYVRPGGILMYSTCTIHRAENEKMVQWICEHFPFEPVSMENALPSQLLEETSVREGYLQLLPGQYGTDGFFFAKLRRKQQEDEESV